MRIEIKPILENVCVQFIHSAGKNEKIIRKKTKRLKSPDLLKIFELFIPFGELIWVPLPIC